MAQWDDDLSKTMTYYMRHVGENPIESHRLLALLQWSAKKRWYVTHAEMLQTAMAAKAGEHYRYGVERKMDGTIEISTLPEAEARHGSKRQRRS